MIQATPLPGVGAIMWRLVVEREEQRLLARRLCPFLSGEQVSWSEIRFPDLRPSTHFLKPAGLEKELHHD
jgi:hypothetical protein